MYNCRVDAGGVIATEGPWPWTMIVNREGWLVRNNSFYFKVDSELRISPPALRADNEVIQSIQHNSCSQEYVLRCYYMSGIPPSLLWLWAPTQYWLWSFFSNSEQSFNRNRYHVVAYTVKQVLFCKVPILNSLKHYFEKKSTYMKMFVVLYVVYLLGFVTLNL